MADSKAFTTLHLYKQNFKFSAAHFLIFDGKNAEKLHGHNYQVKVDLDFGGASPGTKGFHIDFNVLKKRIHERLQVWDEMVLLPALHPEMKTEKKGNVLEVRFRERFYAFPVNEVHLLEMNNTSVENLSKALAQEFYSEFKLLGVQRIRVYVEETRGQGASTEASG